MMWREREMRRRQRVYKIKNTEKQNTVQKRVERYPLLSLLLHNDNYSISPSI